MTEFGVKAHIMSEDCELGTCAEFPDASAPFVSRNLAALGSV